MKTKKQPVNQTRQKKSSRQTQQANALLTEPSVGKKKSLHKGISIRYRLIAAFMVTVLMIVLLGVVSYRKAADAITKSYEETTVAVLERTSDYYSLLFDMIKDSALDLAMDGSYSNYYLNSSKMSVADEVIAYKDLSKNFSALLLSNTLLSSQYIFAKGQRPFFTAGSFTIETANEFAESDEAKLIDEKRYVWMSKHPYIDSVKEMKYGLAYCRQLLNIAYAPCGYVILDISWDAMHSPLDGLDFGDNSSVLFVVPDGGELFTYHQEGSESPVTEKSDNAPEYKFVYGSSYYDKAIAAYHEDNTASSGSEYVDFNGEVYLFSYTVFDDFMIAAMVPQAIILSNLKSIQSITIIIVLASIILASLIALTMAGSITSVIRKLMAVLESFASGDLTASIKIKRKDEFSVLAGSANNAMQNIRELVSETSGISSEVHSTADTVNENARTILNTTKEITQSITEIEDGLLQQAEDTQNCMTQMELLSDKITQVNENSERISDISAETQTTVSAGIEIIRDLNDKATETEASAKEIIQSIMELQTTTEYIVNIVNAINEISDQTNLLSLNASIEAARAGEAGRGFAVVADEIRKLSEQSATSANQIREYVSEITGKTNIAVSFAKKSQETVRYQRDQIDKTVSMFSTMTAQVETLTENLQNITDGIIDIQKSKQGTMTAIESISAVSQQTAASAEEVTSNVTLQLQSLEEFKSQADELIRVSGKLSEAIGKFKVK